MGELALFCNMRQTFKTFILKCPNGKYTFRGSVPDALQPGEIIYCKTLDDCKRIEMIINKLKRSYDLCVKLNQNIIAIEVEAI